MKKAWLVMGSFLVVLQYGLAVQAGADEGKPYADPKRFEKAIATFEVGDKKNSSPAGAILCIGSSSMRGWHGTIRKDLAPLTLIPRGFGGSTMNDVLHFAERVVLPYKPRAVVIYEGDNDIAGGVSPEKIRDTFRALVAKIHKNLPETRVYFLTIKPSIKRWKMWPDMKKANALIAEDCSKNDLLTYVDVSTPMLGPDETPKKEIFKSDNLHMNEKGYAIWKEVLRPVLMEKELKREAE